MVTPTLDPQIRFIQVLTAGRTGSTFVADLIERLYPDVALYQEREPSRLVGVLTNMSALSSASEQGVAHKLAVSLYRRSRTRWMERHGPSVPVVEISPFISGLRTDLGAVRVDRAVHLVRDPVQWVRSAITFGSYSWRRPLVPLLPLVRERAPIADRSWRSMSAVEQFAWRWRWRNERIRAFFRASGHQHAVVRYEDMFDEGRPNIETLRRMVEAMGLPPGRLTPEAVGVRRVNPTRPQHRRAVNDIDEDAVRRITDPEAHLYGYA